MYRRPSAEPGRATDAGAELECSPGLHESATASSFRLVVTSRERVFNFRLKLPRWQPLALQRAAPAAINYLACIFTAFEGASEHWKSADLHVCSTWLLTSGCLGRREL